MSWSRAAIGGARAALATPLLFVAVTILAVSGTGAAEAEAPPSAAPPSSAEALDRLSEALAAEAARVLPAAADTALIVELRTGTLVLEHHPTTARRTRFPPGSVMKAFTAYALTDQERTSFACTGRHRDAQGVERTCWDRRGHGEMRLRTALASSCNVWFYQAVGDVSAAEVLDAWRRFGLPSRGVAGVIDDEVPERVEGRDLPDLAVGDQRALGITPRALLAATVRLATRDASTGLDPGRLEVVAHGLEEAAQSGTLAGVFAGLDVAAKSGTAPRPGQAGMRGLVIGWTPAQRPRFAWVVVRDHGRGARDAGPPARALVGILAAPAVDRAPPTPAAAAPSPRGPR